MRRYGCSGRFRALVALLLVATSFVLAAPAGAASKPHTYSLTKIQDIKRGFKDILANDLTEDGVVVGGFLDQKAQYARAFSFSEGVFTPLGGPEDVAIANAANDAGMAAGVIYQNYPDSNATFA